MFQKPGVGTDPKITTGSATLVFTYRQILFSFFVAVIPDPSWSGQIVRIRILPKNVTQWKINQKKLNTYVIFWNIAIFKNKTKNAE